MDHSTTIGALPDREHYSRLEIGANFLASRTSDPKERAEHLRMAGIYRNRARGSAMAATAH
jgi:hypothetical protein